MNQPKVAYKGHKFVSDLLITVQKFLDNLKPVVGHNLVLEHKSLHGCPYTGCCP